MKSVSEKTFRAFRRQVLKVRQAIKELPDDASITYHLHVEVGQPTQSSFDSPEETGKVRVAVLMRPLLDPNSFIECRRVWELVKEHRDLDGVLVSQIEDGFKRVEAGEGIAFNFNQKPMSQREIYEIFASGEFFHDFTEARQLLKALRFGPMTEMLWFFFYDYAHNMYVVASAVLAAIYTGGGMEELPAIDPRCVFCLTTTGKFTSEEHVIPESFGNDEAVLPKGWVCDSCNNICSTVDQFLTDFEPIALQRVLNVSFTKRGKLPRAEFANVTIEKRMPRVIRLVENTDTPSLQVLEQQEDGTVKFNINVTGRKPLDAQMLGRALFKIALGMVAFQSGRDRACDARYDPARAFITGTSDFDNFLAIGAMTELLHQGIEFNWLEAEEGTPFGTSFYGVGFVGNLEPTPKVSLSTNDEFSKRFTLLPLRLD